MSNHDQRNQNVENQYNAAGDIIFNEGNEFHRVVKPTDIIITRNVKLLQGLRYEASFRLIKIHKLYLICDWYITKDYWNLFDWNLSKQILYNLTLVVDGVTEINCQDLSPYTLNHDELAFKLDGEYIGGKLVLGSLGFISVLIGEHILI